jgi:transposase
MKSLSLTGWVTFWGTDSVRLLNRYLTKRDGKYYLERRVPEDVRVLNPSGSIREALKTSDLATARKLRDRRVGELEALWDAYRVLPKDDRAGPFEAIAGRELVPAEQGSPVEGQRTVTSVAAGEFLARANLKPSTKSLYGKVLKQLGAEFPCLEDLDRPAVRQFLQSYSKDRTAKAVRNLIAAARSLSAFHGYDPGVFIRRQLKRRYVLAFFQKLPACLVGIEACASSHHWSRELKALGHTVRLMPPAYVKPYVNGAPAAT